MTAKASPPSCPSDRAICLRALCPKKIAKNEPNQKIQKNPRTAEATADTFVFFEEAAGAR